MTGSIAPAETPVVTGYGLFKMWHCICECSPHVACCGKESPDDGAREPHPLGPVCPVCEDLAPL
ncbi:hypothetical protein, partial [Listeria monocytogenes]|uniref:hypothetical protein n=1 Tax=Listeria monocytogenes TaxID=1639 RepID=UPI002FDC3C6B